MFDNIFLYLDGKLKSRSTVWFFIEMIGNFEGNLQVNVGFEINSIFRWDGLIARWERDRWVLQKFGNNWKKRKGESINCALNGIKELPFIIDWQFKGKKWEKVKKVRIKKWIEKDDEWWEEMKDGDDDEGSTRIGGKCDYRDDYRLVKWLTLAFIKLTIISYIIKINH